MEKPKRSYASNILLCFNFGFATFSICFRDISTCSYVCMKTQDCNAFSIKSTDKNNCVTYQLADTNIPVSKNSDHPIELWIQKNQFVEASEEEETSSELSFDSNYGIYFSCICMQLFFLLFRTSFLGHLQWCNGRLCFEKVNWGNY